VLAMMSKLNSAISRSLETKSTTPFISEK
jgi:hypothetical protein